MKNSIWIAGLPLKKTTIKNADVIIVSTQHEIETQYSLYNIEKGGKFEVIPPGVNT